MQVQAESKVPIYSTLATDPDLHELVELFVDEMPERIANLTRSSANRQWNELQRLAHQLKGAAGGYGFTSISPAAAVVEDAIRKGDPETRILEALEGLLDLCRRATAAPPAGQAN